MKVRVIIDNNLASHEDLTGTNLEAVEFDWDDLLQIGITKQFDVSKKAIIPYEKPQSLIKERRIVELKQLLSSTDYKIIKYVEGKLSVEEYNQISAQRQAWRDEINELEAEING